jgi:hypothetical protein
MRGIHMLRNIPKWHDSLGAAMAECEIPNCNVLVGDNKSHHLTRVCQTVGEIHGSRREWDYLEHGNEFDHWKF